MSTFLRATQIWLALAVISPGCAAILGAEDYYNYSWLVAMGCWLVVDLYWAWAARNAPPAPGSGKWGALLLTFLVYALYCLPLSGVPLLGQRIVPRYGGLQALGAGMCICGTAFAIWSRRILADSWNAAVSRSERQSLIQHGPYSVVRHPIYLGFLFAITGMIVALGELRALGLLFGAEILFKKIAQEEGVMRAAFPDEYPEYAQKIKRLVPWVW